MNGTIKANMSIRNALAERKMPLWQLAVLAGVSEPTIVRWMRTELPEERQKELIALIEKGEKA